MATRRVVIKDDADPVGIVLWQHLLGAPCFQAVFCSKTIIPDSEEHPLASSRTVPKVVFRWIRAKASLESSRRSSRVQASQVLRKAVIQTSFKELYEIERASLAMKLLEADKVPEVSEISELEGRLETLASEGWIVDPDAMRRGELLAGC